MPKLRTLYLLRSLRARRTSLTFRNCGKYCAAIRKRADRYSCSYSLRSPNPSVA